MQIARAKPQDAAILTQIALAAKRSWGYPENWIEGWRDALTLLPDFIVSHETYRAFVDNRTLGFYALSRRAAGLELLHLWVVPDAMRRGVGRSLFLHAVERAKVLGFRSLEI